MAVSRGCNGKVFGRANGATGAATQVLRVSEWAFDESSEQIESSEIGTCTKSFEAGAKETTGTINVFWDASTGANQAIFSVGSKVDITLYPAGTGSGSAYYTSPTGGATITGISRAGSVDSLVTSVFTFSVNGELTATSVP